MTLTNERGRLSTTSTVIGRAFGDEPIKLMVLSDWGTAVEVRREGDRDSIGFRKEYVYRFEPILFQQLLEAFNAGNQQELVALWNKAQPFGY
jgi:hypothetical protein